MKTKVSKFSQKLDNINTKKILLKQTNSLKVIRVPKTEYNQEDYSAYIKKIL